MSHIAANEFNKYLEASEDWEDPDIDAAYRRERGFRSTVQIKRLPAKGGPFDGEELQVPPGGSQVILPAAFGKEANLTGVAIYERQGQFMVYVGQGDHTEQIEEDEDGGPPALVVVTH